MDYITQGYLYELSTNRMTEVINLETVLDNESEPDLKSEEVQPKTGRQYNYICI